MPERPEHEKRQDRAAACSVPGVPLTRKESWNEKPKMEKSTIKIASYASSGKVIKLSWLGEEIDEAISLDIFSW